MRLLSLALALLGVVGLTPAAQSQIDQRMHESAAAAQALQGAMDGRWILCDQHGRALFVFQIVDRAGDSRRIEAVWSPAGKLAATEPVRAVDFIRSDGAGLWLRFAAAEGEIRMDLHRLGHHRWRGRILGQAGMVTLKRDARFRS